jgi:hypothetical protein
MCRINAFIVAVTLWLTASSSSLAPEIIQYSKEKNSIVPTVLPGVYGKLYSKVVDNTVEYIFEFKKSVVSHSSDTTKDRTGIFFCSKDLRFLCFFLI